MARLICCIGLPACGKTTWATSMRDKEAVVIVSKDDIRAELKRNIGWVWSQAAEDADVIPERDRRITQALNNGWTVISTDTNLQPVHKRRLAQIASDCEAEFIIKKFDDVSIEECIRRDAVRKGDARVGEKVIRDMAKKYLNDYSSLVPYIANKDLPSVIVCDLDGTLSNNKWRDPYDGSKCHDDPIVEPIRNILEVYYRFMDWRIVYLSARDDTFREQTGVFLRKHHCPPGDLFMRPAGDKRRDWIVKSELFDAHVRSVYNVRFVLDDRSQVVQMWRKLGLTCLQVADGDF